MKKKKKKRKGVEKRNCRSLKVLNPIEFHVDNSDAGALLPVERYLYYSDYQHRNMRSRERYVYVRTIEHVYYGWKGMKREPGIHQEQKRSRERI
jgi:hypothetical protein